ncbi:hypothetical protein [Candidatus Enterococcus murrayae]|nr:hypothetical protein [Enterococcus sp. MJM16]
MNNTQTIKTLAAQTNEAIQTVEAILESYENYCNRNITRYSRKHLAAITEFIAAETALPEETCSKVMIHFFDLVKNKNLKGSFKMKKLAVITLALITLGATSQIVEKNIDKEEVKTIVTTNLKEQDDELDPIYFQHDDDKNSSLFEKIRF